MKNSKIYLYQILIIAISCLIHLSVSAQRLDKFGSVSHQIDGHKIPYNKIISYFGYITTDSISVELRNEKKFYYFYFNLIDATDEIGIRLISPVPDVVMPDRGDLVSENYFDNEKDKKNYFDPWIKVERAVDFKSEDSLKKDSCFSWILFGSNDDSSELFAQPDGKSNNSLLRIINRTDSVEKKLLPGLYRIAFTNNKNQTIKGGFVIQVGTNGNIFKGKVFANKEELLR